MKKILIGLGVVLVLLVAAVVIGPSLIPTDLYLDKVTAAVKQATGRDLTISGPVSVKLVPNIALQASGVSLSNAPGAADKAMLTIGKLEVGLKLFPLLSHRIEISRLDLTDPVINLEVDKGGQGNWVFTPAVAPAPVAKPEKTKAAPPTDMAAQLRQLSLGTVKIANGSLSYLDARTGKRQDVSKLDSSLTLTSIDDPLTLKGDAVWRGQKVSFDIRAAKPSALVSGGTTALSVSVDAPAVKLSLDGKAESVGPLKKLDGALDVSGASLRGLVGWAAEPLKLAGSGLGPFALKSNVSLGASLVSLSHMTFSLDAIKASGDLAVALNGARPGINGDLVLGALDLNPYLAATPQGQAQHPEAAPIAAPTAAGGGWSQAPIDLSVLKTVDASLNLSMDSLRLHDIEVGKTALALVILNGRMRTDFKQLTLYGGSGTGHIGIDGSAPGMGLDLALSLSGIQLQPVLQVSVGVDRFSGAGSINLAVQGRGRNQSDVMQSLAGSGSLRVANGAVKGIDLAAIVRNPASALSQDSKTAQTQFSALGGTFTIAGGVASNTDLAMETAVGGVTGAGTIDLFHRTLDYRLIPHVAGNLQGGKAGIAGTEVPILVQGPWASPSYRPDLNSVLQQKAQKALGGKINKLLGDQTGANGANSKAGSLLKGIFGH